MIVGKNGNNGDLAYNETFLMSFTQPTNMYIANRKVQIPCPPCLEFNQWKSGEHEIGINIHGCQPNPKEYRYVNLIGKFNG